MPLVYSERDRDYEIVVQTAHDAASRAVLHVLLSDYQLLARLQSVKRYFLMEQGDVIVHFLDAATGAQEKGMSVRVREGGTERDRETERHRAAQSGRERDKGEQGKRERETETGKPKRETINIEIEK